MLLTLTVAVLLCGVCLGWTVSTEHTLTVLLDGIGSIILFPLTIIVGLLSVSLSAVGGIVPGVGHWGSLLGSFVTGAYGIPWWPYLIGAVPLWIAAILQIPLPEAEEETETETEEEVTAEESEAEASKEKTDTKEATEAKRNSKSRSDSRDLTDIRGVGPQIATRLHEAGFHTVDDIRAGSRSELEAIPGIPSTSAARIKSQVGNVDDERSRSRATAVDDEPSSDTEKSRSDPLTGIPGVNDTWADALRKAGYESVNDVKAASQRELSGVVGNTNAARIKAELGDSENDTETESTEPERTPITETAQSLKNEPDSERDAAAQESDEPQIEQLIEIDDIDRAKHDAIVNAGYESIEDIRTASFSDLEAAVGHKSAVRIRRAVGYVGSTASTSRDNSTTDADKAGTTEETSPADTPDADDTTSDPEKGQATNTATESRSDEDDVSSDKRLETLRQTAASHVDTAMTEPFEEPATTEELLVHGHAEYVALAEQAEAQDRDDVLEAARETLQLIETRLTVLSTVADSLETARESTASDEASLKFASESALETARESYETAFDAAEDGDFDLDSLEREYQAVVAELEQQRRDDLTAAIEEVGAELDHVPTLSDVVARRPVDEVAYRETFETWEAAIEASNIDLEVAIIEDLRAVAYSADGSLDEATYRRNGHYELEHVRSHFGSWSAALDSAFDETDMTSDEDWNPVVTTDNNGNAVVTTEPTRDEYIAAIQRVADASDQVVKSTDVSDQSPYSVNEIVREFGSWQDALDAAGVNNELRLLQELQRVANEVGGRPSTTEMNRHGHVSATLYADYFGTYTNAVEKAFGTGDGSDSTDAADESGENDEGGSDDKVVTSTENIKTGETAADEDTELPFTTISDITEDSRLEQAIAVTVCDISDEPETKKQARLRVEDPEGTQCWLNVWRKHDVTDSWKVDHWYVLEQARGKYWSTGRGESNRQLSSTKDLQVTHIGTDQPSELPDDSVATRMGSDSDETDSDSNQLADDTADDGTEESDDILGELISEFDDLAPESS